MKGQSLLLTHALLVSFTIALVFAVVFTFNNIRKDYQDFAAANDLDQICMTMKTSMEKVYQEPAYQSPGDTVYGSIRMSLPESAGGAKYRTNFANGTLFVAAAGVQTSCKIGLNASYSGTTTGGITEITYSVSAGGRRAIVVEKI
jgi:hypothetical protein